MTDEIRLEKEIRPELKSMKRVKWMKVMKYKLGQKHTHAPKNWMNGVKRCKNISVW